MPRRILLRGTVATQPVKDTERLCGHPDHIDWVKIQHSKLFGTYADKVNEVWARHVNKNKGTTCVVQQRSGDITVTSISPLQDETLAAIANIMTDR